MKTRSMAILITMSLAVLLAAPASGAEERPVKPGMDEGTRGSLEDDMAIFNQAPHSDAVRKFFTSARQGTVSVDVEAQPDDSGREMTSGH